MTRKGNQRRRGFKIGNNIKKYKENRRKTMRLQITEFMNENNLVDYARSKGMTCWHMHAFCKKGKKPYIL